MSSRHPTSRQPPSRLGFAVRLATVRFLGTFLAHPADVPPVVARTVARELAIPDPECLALYALREQTHREHAGEIQRAYGYRDYEGTARAQLTAWLHARARGRPPSARVCCSISRPPA